MTQPNPGIPKSKLEITFGTIVGCFGILGGVFAVIAVTVALFAPERVIVLLREAGGAPEPTAVVIQLPTYTPIPTFTPQSTQSPYPTCTPLPTVTSYPTYTPFPTVTFYPTYTPYPTPSSPPATPIPPTQTPWIIIATETPTPTPTKSDNTLPDTVLAPGEAWRTNGVAAVLSEAEPYSGGIYLELEVYNSTGHSIVFSLDFDVNLIVRDNLGNVYEPGSGGLSSPMTLGDGEHGQVFYRWFSGPIHRLDVEKITVILQGVSQIERATWEIPIHH